MPELPEVETIRRGLEKSILDKKITVVEILNKKTVRGDAVEFARTLKGNKIESVGRIGKLLMFKLADGNYMLAHMKMTGQLIYKFGHKVLAGGHNLPHFTDKNLPTKYSWVIWSFADGSKLYFNDMRKFGYLQIVNADERAKIFALYGIEPLAKNFTLDNFRKILSDRKAPIKTILMNQKLISGIGNIYADEICFHAGIRPDRKTKDLSKAEVSDLYKMCGHIIKEAIRHGGTTFKDYLDAHGGRGNYINYLMVYQRGGGKCLRCKKGIIQVKRVAGRSTHYCPVCQE